MQANNFVFDLAYTSVLKRAIHTLWLCLEALDLLWLPVKKEWRLNERHYGALTGLNKKETVEKHGKEQVSQTALFHDPVHLRLSPRASAAETAARCSSRMSKSDVPNSVCPHGAACLTGDDLAAQLCHPPSGSGQGEPLLPWTRPQVSFDFPFGKQTDFRTVPRPEEKEEEDGRGWGWGTESGATRETKCRTSLLARAGGAGIAKRLI